MRFLSIMSFLFLFPINSHGGAQTLRQVPQHYKTIQSAIDASRIGDTVLVAEGLYYENLHITKNIILASRFLLDGDTRLPVDSTFIRRALPFGGTVGRH